MKRSIGVCSVDSAVGPTGLSVRSHCTMHKPIFLLMLTLGALISAHAEVWVTGPSHVVARNEAKPEASETFDAKPRR